MTDEERFWAKVDRSGECWNWTASLDNKGYGNARVAPDYGVSNQTISKIRARKKWAHVV